MKLRELFEASYDGMIAKMKQDFPERQQLIQEYLKMAKVIFKKEDKVVWWMKNVRQFLQDEANNEPYANEADLRGEFENLTHYFGYNDPAIDNYQFGNKTYLQISADLRALEDKHLAKQKQDAPVPVKQGDYELIKFNDGTAWWFVNRAYCDQEGRSGGHCGNVVGQHKKDQRILSLRKNGQVILTFILEPDGSLGEMKGKYNQKPNAKYHPQIMSLLLSDTVDGITGAGYLPEMNFSIFDLNDKQLQTIYSDKDQLIADQLIAEPMEFFKAPDWIRANENYQMLVKQHVKGIHEIMDEKGNITNNIKQWQRAVSRNRSLILHVPSNYPNLENELIYYLSNNPNMCVQANKNITNNKTIMTQVIANNSEAFHYILPTNPNYDFLKKEAVMTDPTILKSIRPEDITFDLVKAAYTTNHNILDYIPTTVDDYEKICEYAIVQHPYELYSIPETERTYNMFLLFVANYKDISRSPIHNVPEEWRDEKMYKTYVNNSPVRISLSRVPEEHRTLEICKIAVDKHPRNFKYVPDELKPKIKRSPVDRYLTTNYPDLNPDKLNDDEIRKILVKDYIELVPDQSSEQKQQAFDTLIDMKIDIDDVLEFIKKRKE